MVDMPIDPESYDRDDEPLAGSPSQASFADDDPGDASPDTGLGEAGLDWELPEWVDGLDEDELDLDTGPSINEGPGALMDLGDEQPPQPELGLQMATGEGDVEEELTEAGPQLSDSTLYDEDGSYRVSDEEEHEVEAVVLPALDQPEELDSWGIDGEMETGASWLMDLDEGEGGEQGEHPESASGDEVYYEAGEETVPPEGRLRRTLRGRLVLTVVLVAVAFGGMRLYEQLSPEPESEFVPRPLTRSGPALDPVVEGPEAPAPVTEPATAGAVETGAVEATVGKPTDRNPFLALTDVGLSLRLHEGLPFLIAHFTGEPEGAELAVGPQTAEPTPNEGGGSDRATRQATVKPADLVLLPEIRSPFREASAEDLAVIWRGTTVPMDAIDKPSKLLTPEVGNVRVILFGGEVFDGRMYAVGEQKVWLEMSVGRMAMLSCQIDRIEHLDDQGSSPSLGETGSQNFAGLDRVRVRTAGGVFYGRLLNREGDDVTLLTSEGARIRLMNARVEPAGLSRTRIVDASGGALEELFPPDAEAPEPATRKR